MLFINPDYTSRGSYTINRCAEAWAFEGVIFCGTMAALLGDIHSYNVCLFISIRVFATKAVAGRRFCHWRRSWRSIGNHCYPLHDPKECMELAYALFSSEEAVS
jgi:hypothetical protein